MPIINEIRKGQEIGKKRGNYIYLACPKCNYKRWIEYNHAKYQDFNIYCQKNRCHQMNRAYKSHKNDPLYWNGTSELRVGMHKSQPELLKLGISVQCSSRNLMEWHQCPECKRKYWRTAHSKSQLCPACSRIANGKNVCGEKSGLWKGGRWIDNRTHYVWRTIQRDNSSYGMSDSGKIQEHRLIMAKHLGRCLKSWEIVHHKGIRYPQDSIDNKQDNRIENLELITQVYHTSHNNLSRRYHKLEKELTELKQAYTILKNEYNLLKSRLT